MKQILFTSLSIFCFTYGFSQEKNKVKLDPEKLLAELSGKACKCIDSIPDVSKDALAFRIHSCIDEMTGAYQFGSKIASLDLDSGEKNVNISINTNKESKEYKDYYYDMERYLMTNCAALKNRLAANDDINHNSMSDNVEALKLYDLAMDETKKENFKGAIDYYKKAVKIDPNFAFAYDNMGICYRRINEFDKAIEAYEKSLKIDPNGKFPLQNIAIVYQYKKEYNKAIEAYEKLAEVDPGNAEVFYGMGQTYVTYMNDFEKGLDNLCKAYTIYVKEKSPYRSDAEKLIGMVYNEMKSQGKIDKFNEILKKNNINMN